MPDRVVVFCHGCAAKYDVGAVDPGARFRCRQCDELLEAPFRESDEPIVEIVYTDVVGRGDPAGPRLATRRHGDGRRVAAIAMVGVAGFLMGCALVALAWSWLGA